MAKDKNTQPIAEAVREAEETDVETLDEDLVPVTTTDQGAITREGGAESVAEQGPGASVGSPPLVGGVKGEGAIGDPAGVFKRRK